MRVVITLESQLEGSSESGPRADGSGASFTVSFPRGD